MSALVVLPARALTLWQPWAWLVAHGHKPIENRPRGFSHKSFRGDFWIHAGTHNPGADEQMAVLDACLFARGASAGRELWEIMARARDEGEMPLGAIVGRATITDIIAPTTGPDLPLDAFTIFFRNTPPPPVPWHFPDQYGFKVENARPLATPVPCRGYQGFWRVPPDTLALLDRAIAQASKETESP